MSIDTLKQRRQVFVDMLENINITSKLIEIKIIARCEAVSLIQQNSIHVSESIISEKFASDHEISEQNSDSTKDQFRKSSRFSKLTLILREINNNINSN